MSRTVAVRWQDWSGEGLEHLVLREAPDTVSAEFLTVTIDRQRCTCLEPGRRYRYESVDSDFTREIEVDDDGLVVTYPGLFRRAL